MKIWEGNPYQEISLQLCLGRCVISCLKMLKFNSRGNLRKNCSKLGYTQPIFEKSKILNLALSNL